MRRAVVVAVVALVAAACGGPGGPPTRGVLEHDLDGWRFRRYQRLLDVEVWVPDNPAVSHTASYARAAAEKRGAVAAADVVSAVVTRYQGDAGIDRALVRFVRRLARDASYRVEEAVVEDVRLFRVAGGGEAWVMWASPRHVVKLGGRGLASVPDDVVEIYGERYPSRLVAGALDGPLPPGPDGPAAPTEPDAPFDPEDPEPDWQGGGAAR